MRVKSFLSILAVLAALPLIGGYLGAVHPLGDSLAVFRLQGAGALALLSAGALLAGAAQIGRIGMLIALVAGAPVIWSYGNATAPVGASLRVYQKNMLYRNDDLAGLAQDIRASAAEAVLLQEVSAPNLALVQDLSADFPAQLTCPTSRRVGGTVVLSRLPAIPGQEICTEGLTALQVQGPQGPVWLVSLHLSWPYPYNQSAQVAAMLPVLEGLEGPVVLGGDFNMVPWSWAYSALAKAARAAPAGPVQGTFISFQPWLTLPIDHVMGPKGGRVEMRDALGSDHLGLLADLGL